MAKSKKVELEKIPEVMEKIVAVIEREIDLFSIKDTGLTAEENRNLVSMAGTLSTIYKDYRAECIAIEKELKLHSKEDILKIVQVEGHK